MSTSEITCSFARRDNRVVKHQSEAHDACCRNLIIIEGDVAGRCRPGLYLAAPTTEVEGDPLANFAAEVSCVWPVRELINS